MPSTDQPTAGAMRAAEAIIDLDRDNMTTEELAAIIDLESGLKDLVYCAWDYHDAVENMKSEAWVESTEEDLVNALARVEGGGE